MLWMTLWNKLGKQPMKITRHKHVHAIVDGKHYDMDLKFDTKGEPYLVPMQAKEKPKSAEPVNSMRVMDYIISEEVPEVLGSGSQVNWTRALPAARYSQDEAMAMLRERNGNTLERSVIRDGKFRVEYYDFIRECWMHNGETLND